MASWNPGRESGNGIRCDGGEIPPRDRNEPGMKMRTKPAVQLRRPASLQA